MTPNWPNWWNNSTDGTATFATTANAATNSYTFTISDSRKEPHMIDVPAFIQIDLLNGTRITGRVDRYSDPTRADYSGAFVIETEDGESSYVLWAAILRVTVFPLTSKNPSTPAPEPIKDTPAS